MTTILSFDPAIGDTGYALLGTSQQSPDGDLHDWGLIEGGEGTVEERLAMLYTAACELIEKHQPSIVAVEFPFAKAMPGGRARRSVMHLPTYGMAVGVVFAAARASGRTTVVVANDEWGRRFPTRGDDKKRLRVLAVSGLYNIAPERMGCESKAGNVADAVLLARYVMLRHVVGGVER
jgi:Holliday junction resolvasome RuvABC endonuclease subunit